jgi:hypothetical protein
MYLYHLRSVLSSMPGICENSRSRFSKFPCWFDRVASNLKIRWNSLFLLKEADPFNGFKVVQPRKFALTFPLFELTVYNFKVVKGMP